MKAISIRAPHWWFCLYAGKDIECRMGERWAGLQYRGGVLLHASSWFDESDIRLDWGSVLHAGLLKDKRLPSITWREFMETRRGGIVGRATLIDVRRARADRHDFTSRPARNTPCRNGCGQTYRESFARCAPICSKGNPWEEPGVVGLVLRDVKELPFCPWRGESGLFDVDGIAYACAAALHRDGGPMMLEQICTSARELCPTVDRRAAEALEQLVSRGAVEKRGDFFCAPPPIRRTTSGRLLAAGAR